MKDTRPFHHRGEFGSVGETVSRNVAIWRGAVSTSIAAGPNSTDLLISAVTVRNYPNPFAATTTISLDLPNAGHVCIEVFDITGRLVERVADMVLHEGNHMIPVDGSHLASGVYVYRLRSSNAISTGRMIIAR